jgi:hypothetical protein
MVLRISESVSSSPNAAVVCCALLTISCGERMPCEQRIEIARGQAAVQRLEPPFGVRFIEAQTCGGRVWIRTLSTIGESGALWSIDVAAPEPLKHFDGSVLDISRSLDGNLYALRTARETSNSVLYVSILRQGRFVDLPQVPVQPGDDALGVTDLQGQPVVVATDHLYFYENSAWMARRLSPSLREPVSKSSFAAVAAPYRGGSVYVGFHAGEFGGGVHMIDAETGTVALADPRATRDPQEISLDSSPVTAMIPDPQDDGCLLIAAGLSHMGGQGGRVVKICEGEASIVLTKELGSSVWTEPFYALARGPSGFLAVTPHAVYRVGLPGPARVPLSSYENVGGVLLNRTAEGAVVICSNRHEDGRCDWPIVASSQ